MHVTPGLGVGGVPRVIVTLARLVDRAAFQTEVLCLNHEGDFAFELRGEGIRVRLLSNTTGQTDYLAFLRVAKILRQQHVDILHTHNTQAFIDGALARLVARVPVHIHTDHARRFPDKRRYIAAERLLSKLTSRVVGVSGDTSRNLVDKVGIPKSKVVTIPNGIIASPFRVQIDSRSKRESLGLSDAGPVVGVGVRLARQKGLDVLLRAMPSVVGSVPDVNLVVAGYGPLETELKDLSLKLGIAEHVHFLGKRLDMPELLQLFDVYVLPSRWEGLPMVLLEAMAAGCPIIATRVGGVPEVVKQGVSGILVEPEKPSALANAIVTLLQDRMCRRRLASQARRHFQNQFTAERMAQAYERLYSQELQETR